MVWPNFGRIGGSVKGSFLPLKDCGLRLKQAEKKVASRLVMQTHLTVMRSVTFDTTTTTSSVYLGRSPIDVIFHFLFLLLSGKYIPSAFPFGVLHQYQGKKWRHKKSQQNSVYRATMMPPLLLNSLRVFAILSCHTLGFAWLVPVVYQLGVCCLYSFLTSIEPNSI